MLIEAGRGRANGEWMQEWRNRLRGVMLSVMSGKGGTMTFVDRLWLRLPLVGRAVLLGVAAAAAGTLPWAALMSANTRHQSTLPWAVPLMAMYLWLYWRYLVRGRDGRGRQPKRAGWMPVPTHYRPQPGGRLCWRDCSASPACCSFREY